MIAGGRVGTILASIADPYAFSEPPRRPQGTCGSQSTGRDLWSRSILVSLAGPAPSIAADPHPPVIIHCLCGSGQSRGPCSRS